MKTKVTFSFVLLAVSVLLVSCGPSQVALDEQATQTADTLAATRTQVYLDYQASKPTVTKTATITKRPTPTHVPLKRLSLSDIQMVSPEIGWALDNREDTVMRTEDGGETWFVVSYAYKPNYVNQRAIIHALDESRVLYSFGIFDITVGDRASNIPRDLEENIHSTATGNPAGLFVLDDNTIWWTLHVGLRAGGAVAIYRTRDGGLSWELILVDSDMAFYLGDIFMVDENVGWLSAFSLYTQYESDSDQRWHIYKTLDGGYTWENKQLPVPSGPLVDQVNYCESKIVQAGTPDLFKIDFFCPPAGDWYYISRDGGQTWRYWLKEGEVFFLDANTGWRAVNQDDGTAIIELTNNGGISWKEMGSMPGQGAFHFWNETDGWAIAQDDQHSTLWITMDGGSTWEENETFPSEISITFLDSDHGWAYFTDDRKTYLWRTTDGAKTWQEFEAVKVHKDLTSLLASTSAEPTASPSPTPMPVAADYDSYVEPVATMVSETDGMQMVYVPAGTFIMGSTFHDVYVACGYGICYGDLGETTYDQELLQHEVYLDAFWIDRTEVTNAMYAAFLNDQGNSSAGDVPYLISDADVVRIEQVNGEWRPVNDYEDHPAVNVTWYGAQAYCEWAGRRLPTEAEWEKAARGVDARTYPWGNGEDCTLANINEAPRNCLAYEIDGFKGTSPVGSFPGGASPYGALDMAGNVQEWVWDWFDLQYYDEWRTKNPTGPPGGERRGIRGGSFKDLLVDVRTAVRWYGMPPDYLIQDTSEKWWRSYSGFTGFRCAVSSSRLSIVESQELEAGDRVALTSIHMVSEEEGWGLAGSSVLITSDAGRNWREVTPPVEQPGEERLAVYSDFIDADHAWVLYATEARPPYHSCIAFDAVIWFTTDGGQNWRASEPLNYGFSCNRCEVEIDMIDIQSGWLTIEGSSNAESPSTTTHIFRTIDGGVTWILASQEDTGYMDADFTNEQTGWVLPRIETSYMYGERYKMAPPTYEATKNGGKTWSINSLPAPADVPEFFEQYGFCYLDQLNMLSEEVIRLGYTCPYFSPYTYEGEFGPRAYLYASEDGGDTWNTYPLPNSAAIFNDHNTHMIFFDADHGLLLGREMWRTDDGGQTWNYINIVSWDGQFSFVDRFHGWAVARNEDEIALVYTSNGGETWQILYPVIAE